MDRLPALIGEAPGRTGNPSRPLAGRAGKLLCQLAEWPTDDPSAELTTRFYVNNLLPIYPGQDGKGSSWPKAIARVIASYWSALGVLADRPAVILLGWRVADAFGIMSGKYGQWLEPSELVMSRHVVLPHPSGINRTLNDQQVRRLAGNVLRDAAMRGE